MTCGCRGYWSVAVGEVVEGAEAAAVGENLLQKERWETIQQLTLTRDELSAAAHTIKTLCITLWLSHSPVWVSSYKS